MSRGLPFGRGLSLVTTALGVVLLGSSITASQLRLEDLSGRLVDPFARESNARANVFLFLSTECPISSRYAPELRRLRDRFASRGVTFWMIYPNPSESGEAIREHMKAFAYPGRALRDPQQLAVRLTQATVTPEAAVFDSGGRMVYRGRIDDRYVDFGLERPAATKRDLENALDAVLSGRSVEEPVTRAVGCFLADFQS
jgi:AhpC/TSA family